MNTSRGRAWGAIYGIALGALSSIALSLLLFVLILSPGKLELLLAESIMSGTGENLIPGLLLASAWILLAAILGALISAFGYLSWLYAAAQNAQLLGARAPRTKPWDAVFCWFVPLLNLIRPYDVVRAIYSRSEPRTARIEGDWVAQFGFVFPLWWGCWIASFFVDGISKASDAPTTVLVFGGLAVALKFVSALCAMAIVWSIQVRQEQLARVGPALDDDEEDEDTGGEDDDDDADDDEVDE